LRKRQLQSRHSRPGIRISHQEICRPDQQESRRVLHPALGCCPHGMHSCP
jgi:hypothetical protein